MTVSINDLTSATALTGGDQVPISSAANRDTLKMSLALLQSWLQANLTFTAANLATQFATPTTGQTVTVTTGNTWLNITPAATLAALTINLPTDRTDGETVLVNSTQTLTALTVSGASTTVVGAPTTLAANGFFEMRYSGTLNAWYRTG
jgi:hypothetical protein